MTVPKLWQVVGDVNGRVVDETVGHTNGDVVRLTHCDRQCDSVGEAVLEWWWAMLTDGDMVRFTHSDLVRYSIGLLGLVVCDTVRQRQRRC